MRRIFPLLGIIFLIGSFSPPGSIYAQPPAGSNCEGDMAAETAAYIQSSGIIINGNDTQFYSNTNSRVYLLNSEDPVNMRSFAPVTGTFAVINFKDQGGKSVFFTVEQEITLEQITYTVKKGTQILAATSSPRVAAIPSFPGQSNPPIWPPVSRRCLELAAEAEQLGILMRARANSTCERQSVCIGICTPSYDPLHIAWTSVFIEPTSRFCFVDNSGPHITNANWLTVTPNPLVHQALDNAIKKESLLYRAG
jgi:hypothetical protein